MKNKICLFVPVLALFACILPYQVRAVGVGVNPLSVQISTGSSGQGSALLSLTNPSNEPGIFTVSPDQLVSWFTITPAEVRLEAGETKSVEITVHATKPGQYALQLSAVGYPLDRRAFAAASGLKVPLYLTVAPLKQTSWGWRIIGVGISAAFLGGSLFWYFYYWRRRSFWQRLKHRVNFW